MLATYKNVLLPGHNHLLTTGTDDLHSLVLGDNQSVKLSVPVVIRWLWPRNITFLEVASMVVTRWIVTFCAEIAIIKTMKITACYIGIFVFLYIVLRPLLRHSFWRRILGLLVPLFPWCYEILALFCTMV